jgi:hypothetical protein
MKINQKKILSELSRLEWSKAEYARRLGVSRQLVDYYLNHNPKGFRIAALLAAPFHIDPRDLLLR